MTARYRYFGILSGGGAAQDPGGVLRAWTGPDGEQVVEIFRRTLTWERSELLSPMARPHYDRIVEIDELVVWRFIERMTARYGDSPAPDPWSGDPAGHATGSRCYRRPKATTIPDLATPAERRAPARPRVCALICWRRLINWTTPEPCQRL